MITSIATPILTDIPQGTYHPDASLVPSFAQDLALRSHTTPIPTIVVEVEVGHHTVNELVNVARMYLANPAIQCVVGVCIFPPQRRPKPQASDITFAALALVFEKDSTCAPIAAAVANTAVAKVAAAANVVVNAVAVVANMRLATKLAGIASRAVDRCSSTALFGDSDDTNAQTAVDSMHRAAEAIAGALRDAEVSAAYFAVLAASSASNANDVPVRIVQVVSFGNASISDAVIQHLHYAFRFHDIVDRHEHVARHRTSRRRSCAAFELVGLVRCGCRRHCKSVVARQTRSSIYTEQQ